MVDFRYGDYGGLHQIDKRPKMYHENKFHRICPDITLMTPSNLLRKNTINMSRVYYRNIIIPWMNQNIHIVEKLLRIYVWNSKIQ